MQGFKNTFKKAAKSILFFIILGMLFGLLSSKTESALLSSDHLVPVRNKNIYRIRRERADSIDVVVLGDSLSYSSISPMQLWKTYGFTSYVCGQSGQKMNETEDMLKTALSSQSPQIVVLEVDALFRNRGRRIRISDSIETGLNYYIPVFRGHDVWKTLVMEKEYPEENYKGFAFRCVVDPYEKGDYMAESDKKESLPDTTLTHMDRIIDMCKESGAELILVGTPSPLNYNYAKNKAISEYAEEKGLVWLDMNLVLSEVGINWKTDSLDQGDHLNLSGAEKVTAYLGRFLTETYDLPDHRGDPAYAAWADESAAYEEKAAHYLKEIRGKGK